jgi:hypothetical protein
MSDTITVPRVLGLDLGTKTGYAMSLNDGRLSLGTWKLKTPTAKEKQARMNRRCDPRVGELFKLLCNLPEPRLVIFEDVQFASTTLQCQLWAGLRSSVWLAFGRNPAVIVECVPVGTLKKFATGHGGATKEMMEVAFKALGFSTIGLDDNAIDAYFLLRWGTEKFKL